MQHFFGFFNRKFGKNFSQISSEALALLKRHAWKGNVRELKNMVERTLLTEPGPRLEKSHINYLDQPLLPEKISEGFHLPEGGINLEELEKDLIRQALDRTNWNRTQAAKLLGLPYKAFYHRMEKHGFK